MTGEQFTAFIAHMGWSKMEASQRLTMSRNTVARYMAEGAGDDIDYACAAIAFGLPRWSEGLDDKVRHLPVEAGCAEGDCRRFGP